MEHGWQAKKVVLPGPGAPKTQDLVIPNPKLKLMDQVREVLRVKHYAIRTEQAYCDWIKRYVHFHGMRSREDLFAGAEKVELFLSDLAVNGHVAASTQNQAFNALLLVLRCCRWNSVTLPNRWLTEGEYRRSLPVAPLIGDQRCYGGTTAGLPRYQQGWRVFQPSDLRVRK
jgi:hypothetical protein